MSIGLQKDKKESRSRGNKELDFEQKRNRQTKFKKGNKDQLVYGLTAYEGAVPYIRDQLPIKK